MAEKNFNTRIVHKHDIEANWQLAVNFTPKQGELIVYDPDENFSYPRIKIGDGEKNVNALSFITDNVEIGEGGEIIYKQTEEPDNAPVGSLWVDLDEYAGGQLFKQPEEPSTATEGDLWVDTDEEDGGLPGLTDEDNGKILLAQNGQWEVSNNSWNDLNNKPVIYGNTLEWDGNTTGLESIWHENGFYLYKVSNLVISEEELLSNLSMFVGFDSKGSMLSFRPTQSNKTDLGIDMGCVLFTDNGIYFGKNIDGDMPDIYVASFTIPGRQDLPRRKLDEEMLPAYVRNLKEKEKTYFDKISTGGNSLDWDGNTEGLSVDCTWSDLYKISDIVPSYEDWQKGGTITFNNQGKVEKTISFPIHEYDIVERERVDGLPGCVIDLDIYGVISTIEVGEHSCEPGLYVIKNSDFYISNIILNDYAKFPKKVLKKEVLPQNFILPEVTSENEGQILRVVNGVWTLVDFPIS